MSIQQIQTRQKVTDYAAKLISWLVPCLLFEIVGWVFVSFVEYKHKPASPAEWELSVAPFQKIFHKIELVTILFIFGIYGLGRISRHPLFNKQYRNWLESTPWTTDRPLPMGSFLPSLPLLLGVAVSYLYQIVVIKFYYPLGLIGLCMGLSVTLILSVVSTQKLVAYYLALFALVLAHFPLHPEIWMPGAIVIFLFLVYFGLRSLSYYPYAPKPDSPRELGWMSFLAPVRDDRVFNQGHGLKISLIIGTAISVWLKGYEVKFTQEGFGWLLLVIFLIALARFGITRSWHGQDIRPNIPLFGFLKINRLYLPRYDEIIFNPLIIFFLSPILAVAGYFFGLPDYLCYAIAVACAFYFFFETGPNIANWRLTAPCTIKLRRVHST